MRKSFVTVDGFAPEARALRAQFEEKFSDPRSTRNDRFVWDLWNVPNQYTALRTPAYLYFSKRVYDAFHQRLVWWGRRNLGCHDVSPPWLSCYVNGCEQRLHGDLPHGHWAFVYSLTPWATRRFTGGETLLVRDEVLDFFRDFRSERSIEEPDVLTEIEPRFNRLTVFDPRIPHGVRRVDGSMNPVDGRLVIHGWFVQPRPFIEGPLKERELASRIDDLSQVLAPALQAGLPVSGLASFSLQVSAAGQVTQVRPLCDTTRVPAELEPERRRLLSRITRFLKAVRFSKQRAASRITLPVVFERG